MKLIILLVRFSPLKEPPLHDQIDHRSHDQIIKTVTRLSTIKFGGCLVWIVVWFNLPREILALVDKLFSGSILRVPLGQTHKHVMKANFSLVGLGSESESHSLLEIVGRFDSGSVLVLVHRDDTAETGSIKGHLLVDPLERIIALWYKDDARRFQPRQFSYGLYVIDQQFHLALGLYILRKLKENTTKLNVKMR